MSTVLGLLEEFDFHVRWPAVKLLSSMLTHRPRQVQEMVLISPMGVSKLMDLLGDSREVVRNDVRGSKIIKYSNDLLKKLPGPFVADCSYQRKCQYTENSGI